jgi:four helix bundle protein
MSGLQSFEDLEVWKKSLDLTEAVYEASRRWPREEKFGLTQQLRRAAASIPANIAEGAERQGTREFLRFLSIAKGSLAETKTFLVLAGKALRARL